MAWKQVKVEDQRNKFIYSVLNEGSNFSDICKQFGISRKTGYKWLSRFQEHGTLGLIDQNKAPHTNPTKIDIDIENSILDMRLKFTKFGPKKIHAMLHQKYPETNWPCISTIGNILSRNGYVISRQYRKRVAANTLKSFNGTHPNHVWCMDFKGTIRTNDNKGHDPFTLTDSSSRYIIKCHLMNGGNNSQNVWNTLKLSFLEYGLPEYILSDNGPPFATVGAGRFSNLSINLIKAGVNPIWITPGKPQENGRHERMHGTLQREIEKVSTREELKIELKRFQEYFNFERPHEALGQVAPGTIYVPSNRKWDGILRSPEYDSNYQVRKVQKSGQIDFKGEQIFIGEAFYGEYIGILEKEETKEVFYGPALLGNINKKQKMEFERIKKAKMIK